MGVGIQLPEPGDAVVLYTDGVTRFRAALRNKSASGPTPCRDVIDEVLSFQRDAEPADDLALLVLQRLPA